MMSDWEGRGGGDGDYFFHQLLVQMLHLLAMGMVSDVGDGEEGGGEDGCFLIY